MKDRGRGDLWIEKVHRATLLGDRNLDSPDILTNVSDPASRPPPTCRCCISWPSFKLGRVHAQAGDDALSRKQYEASMTTWKDADADV